VRESEQLLLPEIVNGTDLTGLVEGLMPGMVKHMEGGPLPSDDDIDALLAALPDKPDETLR